jgi:large subunit ribosomal protein L21
MSKYAVIKVGSSQERVSVGDEFSVSSSFDESTLVPVLVSPRKGQIVIDNKELKNYKVELEFISKTKSKKMNIFQYKNKTGNRRRVGYRENTKIVKVKSIQGLESVEEE